MVHIVTMFELVVGGGSNAACDVFGAVRRYWLGSSLFTLISSYQRLYSPNKFSCYGLAEATPRRRIVTDCGREVTVRSHRCETVRKLIYRCVAPSRLVVSFFPIQARSRQCNQQPLSPEPIVVRDCRDSSFSRLSVNLSIEPLEFNCRSPMHDQF